MNTLVSGLNRSYGTSGSGSALYGDEVGRARNARPFCRALFFPNLIIFPQEEDALPDIDYTDPAYWIDAAPLSLLPEGWWTRGTVDPGTVVIDHVCSLDRKQSVFIRTSYTILRYNTSVIA